MPLHPRPPPNTSRSPGGNRAPPSDARIPRAANAAAREDPPTLRTMAAAHSVRARMRARQDGGTHADAALRADTADSDLVAPRRTPGTPGSHSHAGPGAAPHSDTPWRTGLLPACPRPQQVREPLGAMPHRDDGPTDAPNARLISTARAGLASFPSLWSACRSSDCLQPSRSC